MVSIGLLMPNPPGSVLSGYQPVQAFPAGGEGALSTVSKSYSCGASRHKGFEKATIT